MVRSRVIETATLLFENIVRLFNGVPRSSGRWDNACPYPRPDALLKVPQNLEQRLVVRQFVDVVNVFVTDDAFFVHDESRSFSVALRTQDAILLSYLAMRPEIAQQKNFLHLQRLGPGIVGGCAVHTYTQNLGIYLLEARHVGFEGGDFL